MAFDRIAKEQLLRLHASWRVDVDLQAVMSPPSDDWNHILVHPATEPQSDNNMTPFYCINRGLQHGMYMYTIIQSGVWNVWWLNVWNSLLLTETDVQKNTNIVEF